MAVRRCIALPEMPPEGFEEEVRELLRRSHVDASLVVLARPDPFDGVERTVVRFHSAPEGLVVAEGLVGGPRGLARRPTQRRAARAGRCRARSPNPHSPRLGWKHRCREV